jgi:hypothetical protein
MQSVSNFSPSVMPFVKNEACRCASYFIFPKRLYKHYISFGLTTEDILDYKKLRKVFSQKDMAELEFYNSYIFTGKIYNKVNIYPGLSFNPIRNEGNIWQSLSVAEKTEYESVIIPMSEAFAQEYKEKYSQVKDPVSLNEKSWSFYPLSNPQYYLIVIEDTFLRDLQIRSKAKNFVSECLQHDIQLCGLDATQRRSLYGFYLKLLHLETQNIELL